MSRSLLPAFCLLLLVTAPLRAQSCKPIVTRTAPGALSGRPIDSVRVVTLPPDPLPLLSDLADRLHVRTQESTIRRQLLFAPGDTVDTLKIAETMRRLRGRRYLTDAWLVARTCEGAGGTEEEAKPEAGAVSLTLTTRDAWSTRPKVRVGKSGSATVGLEERNLFGTGRAASLYVRSVNSRIGLGASLSDPWVPHTNLTATLSAEGYGDGSEWLASVESRRLSIFDPWQTQLTVTGSTYRGVGDTAGVFSHQWSNFLIAHVVHSTARGVTSVVGGFELDRSSLYAGPEQAIIGPATVRRRFVGLDAGVRRESASYDTLAWLLPEQTFAEIPSGLEWDVVSGLGADLVSHQPMIHTDLWLGRAWEPGRGRLFLADLWSSGFITADRWDAGTLRAHLSYFSAARSGTWQAHLAWEHLFAPDPDVRALATLDPVLPLFRRDARLAETASTASLERDIDLRKLSHAWALQGALFSAFTLRSDPVSPNPEQLYAGVIGAGLRITPLHPGRATLRVDVGIPVTRSPGVRRGPYIGLLVVPWLGADRDRDGRR
jgi:hypothetical protein